MWALKQIHNRIVQPGKGEVLESSLMAFTLTRLNIFSFQCCNDIVEGRFPLKQDIVLRLAALHMHQHALSTKMGKVTVKGIR